MACAPDSVARSVEPELLDTRALPEPVVERAYRDLTRLHRFLGNMGRIARAIRRDPLPVRHVLDVGCGHGGAAAEVGRRLGVVVLGVDVRPPRDAPVPIIAADAVRDPLPRADVAYSLCLAHHLTDAELFALVCNVGRSCRRLILVDLVRHWMPMAMFRTFVVPFFSAVAAADGMASIRRAYTPEEMSGIVGRTGARFRHSVAPYYTSQTVDIVY
jgi:SAM-dependent methyltransferase